ncbi:unnamed protein product [Dracunculus medinensis]|uniref:Uncharacterized protein n=1 Tax=Dracunculus medinensis TaxID=318479 RepID=A0A0N4UNG9_DRAME|nr:unnamed protein product [Dracunculus medinensis]
MSIAKSSTMPSSLFHECGDCSFPPRYSANILADCLKVSPAYRQQDSQRWNAAINCYQEMRSYRSQCCTSPPNSPVDLNPGASSIDDLPPCDIDHLNPSSNSFGLMK